MADAGKRFLFGRFELVPDRRALYAHGQDALLRGRAFDLLLALVERRGRVVSKDELLGLVWPGRIVEEGNLTVHVAGLRKLLGDGVIATVSGRGYRFVAPVEELPGAPAREPEPDRAGVPPSPAASEPAPFPDTLPRALTRLVGRSDDLDRIAAQLDRSRLVTVVGPGGMGKTRLALAAADSLRGRYPDGVWLVELGPLEDPELVRTAIASALGVQVRGGEVCRGIAAFLAGRRGLIVLDGCEHMLEAAAAAVEAIVGACPDVAVIATSREPLRADGERLHRLGPLGAAAPDAEVTADRLADYPAGDLFLERAGAVLGEFAPTDAQAADVMEICRRLDGIPLSIELAAAALQALTTAELKARLDARFELLTAGRRAALPRQQTLRATVGWSLDLLRPEELDLLLRLSVFAAGWTTEAAASVAGRAAGEEETLRLTAALVEKSLVQADLARSPPRYRMLDTTRHYAAERLQPRAKAELRSDFARWLLRTYERAEADWPTMADGDWFERYAPEVGNLRAGLAWALGPDGDEALGVRLASFTEHVWSELAPAPELRRWFDAALSKVTGATPPDVAGRLWLGLCGWLSLGDPRALAASGRAVALFRTAGARIDLGRALWRHGHQLLVTGALDAAEPFLEEAGEVLRGSGESKALVSWLRARALSQARRAEFGAALGGLDEALSLARRIRSPRDVGLTLASIAETRFAVDDVDRAIEVARDGLESLGGARDRSWWAQPAAGALASYLLVRNATAEARPLMAEQLHAARAMGLQHELVAGLERLGLVAAGLGDFAFAALSLGHGDAHHAATKLLRGFGSDAVHRKLAHAVACGIAGGEAERLAREGARLTSDQVMQRASELLARMAFSSSGLAPLTTA